MRLVGFVKYYFLFKNSDLRWFLVKFQFLVFRKIVENSPK